MMRPEAFSTHTLTSLPEGPAIMRILAASVNAVDPEAAVERSMYREGSRLIIRSPNWMERPYDLQSFKRVRVFALGKAAVAMSRAAAVILPEVQSGLMVVKHPSERLPAGFEHVIGGHPVPSQGSLEAGRRLKKFLSDGTAEDLLICLISGGGSALLTLPRFPAKLQDLQTLTKSLLACGASINEINILRRELDLFKGGGLARLAAPAQVISLILSDVIGNPLEAIASGPTVPNPSSAADALETLKKYDLQNEVPDAILKVLHAAEEAPKPDDALFAHVQNEVIGDNILAAVAALEQARNEGFSTIHVLEDLKGEARLAALDLTQQLRSVYEGEHRMKPPFCMVAGGETTVTLRGAGLGGRNQELALAGVPRLAELPGSLLVSLATDGEDGPTDAAGAVAASDTLRRSAALGLDVQSSLQENDSYHFFSELGDLLKPGPTGTNVNDLTFLFGLLS